MLRPVSFTIYITKLLEINSQGNLTFFPNDTIVIRMGVEVKTKRKNGLPKIKDWFGHTGKIKYIPNLFKITTLSANQFLKCKKRNI